MDSICDTPLWDSDLTWNTDNPDFTPCFQSTILVWVPFGFYLCFLPIEAYKIYSAEKKKIIWNLHSVVTLAMIIILLLLSIVDLIFTSNLNSHQDVPTSRFIAAALSSLLYLMMLMSTVYQKKTYLSSSGIRLFLWIFLSVATIITFRSMVMKIVSKAEIVYIGFLVVEAIRCPVIIASLLVCCSPDSSVKRKDGSPEHESNFLARSFFWWVVPLMYKGSKETLKVKNLTKLSREHTCSKITPEFETVWLNEVSTCQKKSVQNEKECTPSIKKVLLKYFGPVFLYAAVIDTIGVLFTFGNPFFLNLIITFATSNDASWKGYLYAFAIFLSTAISTTTMENVKNYYFVIGMQVKTAVTSIIYKKCFKLSSQTRQEWSAGEIVNLMSVDTQRLTETCNNLFVMWEGVLQIVLPVYFLYTILGVSMLTGIGIMILAIPLNLITSNIMEKIQIRCMELKDERTNLISEILNGMKILKLYAWEGPFRDKVLAIREKETEYLKNNFYVLGVFFVCFVVTPYLVALGCFTTYILIDVTHVLTPNIVFVSLALLNIMRIPMQDVPFTLSTIIQANVSLNRINNFLNSDEIDVNNVTQGRDKETPVKITNGTFKWSNTDNFNLKDVNLEARQNKLIAVVGSVGSGKSSLLAAILGDMMKINGDVTVSGNIAYVPQQAWIKYATIEENVLFYKSKNDKKYKEVVKACCLESDLEILPAGDQTEIGEKGINLSGGQKQRVSLARAVYSDADIYLFDDALSAVDAHVGKDLFQNVIGPEGILKNKTRIMVTHGLHYLTGCDYIYVLNEGVIVEHGTYETLLNSKSAFSQVIMQYIGAEEDISDLSDEEYDKIQKVIKEAEKSEGLENFQTIPLATSEQTPSKPSFGEDSYQQSYRRKSRHYSLTASMASSIDLDFDGKLIEDETVAVGATNRSVYMAYAKYTGIFMCTLFVLGFALFHAAEISANQWLSEWSLVSEDRSQINYWLTGYGIFGIFQILAIGVAFYIMGKSTSDASTKCHNLMLHNVIRAPMSFFDTTPIGRILNRFARDVSNMDITFIQELQKAIFIFWKIVGAVIIITIGVPLFIAALVPIALLYVICLVLYLSTSRQLMRLESVTRSPIYTLFSESINGASCIRAFRKQSEFISDCFKMVDENQRCYYPYIISQRWVATALQFLGALIIFSTCIFVNVQRGSIDGGTIGLVITYSIATLFGLYYGVRCLAMVEANIVSVERILEYTKLQEEADWVIPSNRPEKSWPEKGKIAFGNYQVRYREGLPLVLKGINVNIKPQEKIGIVGRTGAGKSSLTLCLFRILEAAGGKIVIDGINISAIGLHDLRSKLTIIPQDPVLFLGTLRFNLDPFSTFTDEEIYKALEQAHLKNYVNSLKQGLDHPIQEGGENLSVGQRQLICLVRALLRKTKILILDEATAAIDLETDSLIQETIRKEFSECTILTIAHRLNTIMDSDRVMVLDAGLISEFEEPSKLLTQPDSIFYGMAKDAGLI